MPNHRFTTHFVCALAALTFSATLQAQANRTFVSTSGSDANTSTSCGPAAPCRTFAAALPVTNSGGEVVVLTSGGYGAFTITQAVTITAIGVDASITAASGDGIDINTTGNVTVTGLGIHGQGAGLFGIDVTNVGSLQLYNVTVENFVDAGIYFRPSGNSSLSVYDSHFSNIGGGSGVLVQGGNAYVKGTTADNNGVGFSVTAGSAVIEDSVARYSGNAGFFVLNTGALSMVRDAAVQNLAGVRVSAGNLQFAYCNIAQNTAYAIDVEGGTVTGSSPGTSVVQGTINGTLGTAATLQ